MSATAAKTFLLQTTSSVGNFHTKSTSKLSSISSRISGFASAVRVGPSLDATAGFIWERREEWAMGAMGCGEEWWVLQG